ncbi:hypothetical protein HID58_081352 [Brassica napus]|uniref:phosphoserine phosphatase n=1 Tax=Brassica napus TaxID=3708 RepID=A0ABQ7Y7L2_BRANA|nr:hypothetical protein HID58_081352 [Brassica napus]
MSERKKIDDLSYKLQLLSMKNVSKEKIQVAHFTLMRLCVGGTWCVCREGLSEAMLQKTLDYACGAGADCGPIHQNGPCFNPNTVKSHCSYAVNSFFQKKRQSQGTCDFAGTATVSASDPSYTTCAFPASSSGSGTMTPVTTTPSTRVPTTTNTRPYTVTPSTGGGLGIPAGGLMEALLTSRAVPVQVPCRKLSSLSDDLSCLELRRYPCRRGGVSIMSHPRLVRLVTASVQPQRVSALGHQGNTAPSKEILDLWRNVEAVCFDVDSTVCVDEGIDELAEFCGAGKAVAEWTARAMGGSVPFEEALAARLSLFKPSLSKVDEYLEKTPPRLSPGIEELVKKLRDNKIDVYLISGGFRQMINPVASILGIPRENIFANNLLFGNSGEFVGFDEKEPTSRSGGKAKAVQHIRKGSSYKTMVMIGDGATDLERSISNEQLTKLIHLQARIPGGGDLFICYAGVQLREAVAAQADWLIFNFEPLINSLD